MPNKIIKKYFEVVPLFRYKEIELKERLALIFYVVGFGLSVIAFTTTLLLGMSFWINIPNVVVMLLCLLLPFVYPKDFVKLAKIILYFVAFFFLPITYYINGGHNGVGILYFLMMAIYFTFYYEGRKLIKIFIFLLMFYTFVIISGYLYPQLVISYTDDTSRIIDIVISFVSIALVISILANVIFMSYRIEKESNEFLLEELEKQNLQLELLSTIDQLTCVYNRRFFLETLEKELEYFKESKKNFYIMMIDLDDFKYMNDTFGHLYGDEILKKVSSAIKSCLRDHDLISRYGGDEFSVIISHATEENGSVIAERIRKTVEELEYRDKKNITISIGIVRNLKDDTAQVIMKRADDYLYLAKANGKNRVEGK